MQQLQPAARIVKVPNSGHGITSENPEFMVEQLRLFVNEMVLQGAR